MQTGSNDNPSSPTPKHFQEEILGDHQIWVCNRDDTPADLRTAVDADVAPDRSGRERAVSAFTTNCVRPLVRYKTCPYLNLLRRHNTIILQCNGKEKV